MSGAITAGVIIAGAGAYSARQQAQAANKPRTGYTDQTTTQNPYHAELIEPDLNEILWRQRQIAEQGIPQVDFNGNLTYVHRDNVGMGAQPAATAPAPTAAATGRGGRGAGAGGAVPAGMRVNKQGKVVPVKNPTGAKPDAGAGAAPATPTYNDPQSVFSEAARRGFNTGNTETMAQGRAAVGNILGGAGTSTGQDPTGTGFEGYNPVLDRQARRLEADADARSGLDLLQGFLGETGRGSNGPNLNTYTGNGTGGGGGRGGALVQYRPQSGDATATSTGPNGQPTPPGLTGNPWGQSQNTVPDSMVADSYFADETRKIMDEQANEAELETLIKAMNEDVEKGMWQDMAQLDAAAIGAGRFGGDMWKGMSRDAREEALQEMLKTASGVRVGDRESRRQARLAALTGVNNRDQALLNANVQREGIAAGERSSAAASAANAGVAADQLALARRGQDLDAINAMLDYEKFGLGQITNIGGQLSSDRMGALGMVPGLEGVSLAGLDAAVRAGSGMTDLRGQQVQAGIARQQSALAQQGLNLQRSQFNAGMAQNQLNDYLGTLRNIGSLGGSSRTYGSNVQPGLGVNPNAAMLQGAAGGFMSGYGAVAGSR